MNFISPLSSIITWTHLTSACHKMSLCCTVYVELVCVLFCSPVFLKEFEWSFSQDLSAILVKQEEPDVSQRLDPQPLEGPPLLLSPAPPHRGSPWKHTVSATTNDNVVDVISL